MENENLDGKLDKRRKELHVLLSCIHGLEARLKNEEAQVAMEE